MLRMKRTSDSTYLSALSKYLVSPQGTSTPTKVVALLQRLNPRSVGMGAAPSLAQIHNTRVGIEGCIALQRSNTSPNEASHRGPGAPASTPTDEPRASALHERAESPGPRKAKARAAGPAQIAPKRTARSS